MQLVFVHFSAPTSLMYPEAHSVQFGEPAAADVFAVHCVQVAIEVAPVTLLA